MRSRLTWRAPNKRDAPNLKRKSISAGQKNKQCLSPRTFLKWNKPNSKGCETKVQQLKRASPNSKTQMTFVNGQKELQTTARRHPTERQSELKTDLSQNQWIAVPDQIAIADSTKLCM
jgi:hypothetical protein